MKNITQAVQFPEPAYLVITVGIKGRVMIFKRQKGNDKKFSMLMKHPLMNSKQQLWGL